jgi:ATP-dependent DNA helicase RecQ
LVSYFGETTASKCGICSVCKGQRAKLTKSEIRQVATQILTFLEGEELSSRELVEKLTFAEADVLKVIRLLLEAEKIKMNPKNQYYLY